MLDNLIGTFHDIKAKRENGEGGFTLIELLVVVVIIGILIAIAIPLYLNYQKGAKDKSSQSDLRAAVSAINQCYTDNSNSYPTAVTFSGSVGVPQGTSTGTPAVNPCANDKINLSDGTTMTYTLATGGASYSLSAYNSGGNRDSSNPYNYNSLNGGKVG